MKVAFRTLAYDEPIVTLDNVSVIHGGECISWVSENDYLVKYPGADIVVTVRKSTVIDQGSPSEKGAVWLRMPGKGS